MAHRVLLALCHAVALALFVHGFLLTRVHLPKQVYFSGGQEGTADEPRAVEGGLVGGRSEVSDGVSGRIESAPYKKLVWIIVDALRYDFVVDDARYGYSKRNVDMPFLSSFVAGPDCSNLRDDIDDLSASIDNDAAPQLGCDRDVIEYARVARFVADAPTTTTQRLSSMTTGSLPIFFDISSAFSASAVDEDNLIDRFRAAGKRMLFMGDSTWDGLYPTQFDSSHPFPCYNIMDLHSVDDGIGKLLVPAIRNMTRAGNRAAEGRRAVTPASAAPDTSTGGPYAGAIEPEWDVVVAHYLGVDHAGHAYGVESPQMKAKLRQIDDSIREVVLALESSEGTLVVVTGDHGQTLTGDHGGGGPEEVDSALVAIDIDAYYRRKRKGVEVRPGSLGSPTGSPGPFHSMFECMQSCTCGEDGNQCVPDVTQIDLVPTLSGLLGIPIPYVNLGKVSAEIWSLAGHDSNVSFTGMLRENAYQVHRYLGTYAKQPGARLPKGAMQELSQCYAALSSDSVPKDYLEYLSSAEELARRAWTQFHDGWMVLGCVCALGSVALHAAMLVRSGAFREGSHAGVRATISGIAPWIVNLLHPVGIFSFFFLLSEGAYTSWIVVLTAISVYWPRRGHSNATTGLILTCAACLLISSVGLQNHSGFGFWQRLTVHDDEAGIGGSEDVTNAGPPLRLSPLPRVALEYILPTTILVYTFASYTSRRSLLRGVETIYRVYLAAGTAAMLAYKVVTIDQAVHADGYIPAQVCYAFIAALIVLSVGARIGKRLTADEFLTVLSGTVALLITLISPVATPLVILGLFSEMYGFRMICMAPYHNLSTEGAANGANPLKGTRTRRGVARSNGSGKLDMDLINRFHGVNRRGYDLMALSFSGCIGAVQTQAFYVSGHLCEFSGLIYTAAFVGQKDYDIIRSGLLLGFDTCGCMVLVIILGALLLRDSEAAVEDDSFPSPFAQNQPDGRTRSPSATRAFRASLSPSKDLRRTFRRIEHGMTDGTPPRTAPPTILFLSRSSSCCAAMVSAGIQRRHLYAWALFAPKFVFEAYFCVVTDVVILALGVLV